MDVEPKDALREAVAEQGLSRKEAAQLANVSETQIWRLITGRAKPSFDTDARLRRNLPGYAERLSREVA